MRIYKLTDQEMKNYNGFQWKLNKWYRTSGRGDLCDKGWLHCYRDKNMAVLMNPVQADIKNPRMFVGEGKGKVKHNGYLKSGFSKMRLVKEIKLPEWNTTQKVAFVIYCALEVYQEKSFVKWAENWLSGKDRSKKAAAKVARKAWETGTVADTELWEEETRAAMAAEAAEAAEEAEEAEERAVEVWGARVAGVWRTVGAWGTELSPSKFKEIIRKARKIKLKERRRQGMIFYYLSRLAIIAGLLVLGYWVWRNF